MKIQRNQDIGKTNETYKELLKQEQLHKKIRTLHSLNQASIALVNKLCDAVVTGSQYLFGIKFVGELVRRPCRMTKHRRSLDEPIERIGIACVAGYHDRPTHFVAHIEWIG